MLNDDGERRTTVVIDTDTYNEVDDQFALVWALRCSHVDVEAIYAAPFCYNRAPFFNMRSESPDDGMQRSFDEIGRTLSFVQPAKTPPYFRGSRQFLRDRTSPETSDAVRDLIERARSANNRLTVVAIAALTNIAHALLIAPDIAEKLTVVWLGGQPYAWPDNREFNLMQDIAAVRTVFDSDVRLVHIPCKGVASHLTTTSAELHERLKDGSECGRWLTQIVDEYLTEHRAWTKTIWDIAPIAWLISDRLVRTVSSARPTLQDDGLWCRSEVPREVEVAYWVERDLVFERLFEDVSRWPHGERASI